MRSDIHSETELLEQKTEEAEQEKETLENREIILKTALGQLEEDIQVSGILEKTYESVEQDRQGVLKKLEEFRECVQSLHVQMKENADETERSWKTIQELKELDEDVSESEGILLDRMALLKETHKQLEAVAARLGMQLDAMECGLETDVSGRKASQHMKPRHTIGDLIAGIFGKKERQESGKEKQENQRKIQDFSGFVAAEMRPGQWNIIGGAGFEAYSAYDKNIDQYTVDRTGYENDIVQMVDINSIEGVYLWQDDIDNPGRFWSQHDSEGTKESFVEIASHIPEVREQLNRGVPLNKLLEDERLGACASLYFDPLRSNAPTLLQGDGFYVFQSNGRHRVLAAKELGYSFPMRITGRLIKKDQTNN